MKTLLLTASLGAAVLSTTAASAQTAASSPASLPTDVTTAVRNDQLEDIVVVARKRETNLQDTSGSIAAFSSDAITKLGITDISGLKGLVPNVSIGEPRLTANSIIAIRGIAGQDGGIGQDEPVAVYLDGVYLGQPQGQFFSLVDIERIEVLKGPQGTLYGRNSTAGAINIITRKPSSQFGGTLEAGTGNFGYYHARGAVEGGIAPRISARLSFNYSNFGGDLTNTLTGRRERASEEGLVRLVTRYDGASLGGPTIDLSADYGRTTAQTVLKNLTVNGGSYGDPDTVSLDLPGRRLRREIGGAGLTIQQKLSDGVTLTSVSGYRHLDLNVRYDADATDTATFLRAISLGLLPAPFAILRDSASVQHVRSDAFSEELRVSGDTGRLKWMVGGFAYDEKSEFDFRVNFLAQSLNLLSNSTSAGNRSTSLAGFTHLEWAFADRFELEGGLRYSYERKAMHRAIVAAAPVPSSTVEDLAKSWGNVTGDVTLNFRPMSGILGYLTVAQGFKSGGFNATQAGSPAFNPERVVSYEAGVKTDFLDRRARLNVSVFHMNYDDLQVRFAAGIGQITIQNAAKATIDGVELEALGRVAPGLTLGFSGAYLDARYDRYSLGALDLSGNRLNQAPRWSLRASADYETALGRAGQLDVHAGYSWQSREYYRAQNDLLNSNPGYENLEARIGFSPSRIAGATIELWGKNLTDDRYVGAVVPLANDLVFIGSINRGRSYGVDLRFKF